MSLVCLFEFWQLEFCFAWLSAGNNIPKKIGRQTIKKENQKELLYLTWPFRPLSLYVGLSICLFPCVSPPPFPVPLPLWVQPSFIFTPPSSRAHPAVWTHCQTQSCNSRDPLRLQSLKCPRQPANAITLWFWNWALGRSGSWVLSLILSKYRRECISGFISTKTSTCMLTNGLSTFYLPCLKGSIF